MIRKLLFVFILVCFFSIAKSSHIIHGNVYYEYFGKDINGLLNYKVSFVLYRDCVASPVQFEPEIEVGVYLNDAQKNLFKSFKINMQSETDAEPVFFVSSKPALCLKKATYVLLVQLPQNSTGYHVSYERCCRVENTNIPKTVNSATYYAFIPPLENNSPLPVSDKPVFFNVGEWVTYSFFHSDNKDGDSLSYEFAPALSGILEEKNPLLPPAAKLTLPIKQITYKNGYSARYPLGTGNSATIDSVSGQLRFFAKQQGSYLITIKVTEWRAGVIIAEYPREITVTFVVQPTTSMYINLYGNYEPGKTNKLYWTTKLFPNKVYKYYLERMSDNDPNWKTLLILDSTKLYYYDTAIQYNNAYSYRITADTLSGGQMFSNVVRLEAANNGWTLSVKSINTPEIGIYPNPTREKIFIQNPAAYKISEGYLLDALGKQVAVIKENELKYGIDVTTLAKGIYLLSVYSPDGLQTLKFYKE